MQLTAFNHASDYIPIKIGTLLPSR